MVLSPAELQRIKSESIRTPIEQTLLDRKQNEQELAKLQEIAKKQTAHIMQLEEARKANPPPSEIDVEAKQKNDELLAKAQRQLEENEDEIKRLNELILNAKCMAIREAQIAEKKTITHAEKQEQERLDAMMEAARIRDIERIHERDLKIKEESKKSVAIIKQQIKDREEAAILEAERKEQEANVSVRQWKEQDEREEHKKLEKKKKQREHLHQVQQANLENTERKKVQKEQAKEEDLRIIQYLVEKNKKEEEREVQEKLKKQEKEKEMARLLALQKTMQDKRSEQDALRAKRASEAYEREWRRKEKELALKKIEQENQLREARLKQQQDREHVIAVEAFKMKQEFFDMLKSQKDNEAKEKNDKLRKSELTHQYATEIKSQINKRETERKKERETVMAESQKFKKEQQEKKSHLDVVKARKLQELRDLGIPEKYCNEIRRQMKDLEKQKISNQPMIEKKAAKTEGKAKK